MALPASPASSPPSLLPQGPSLYILHTKLHLALAPWLTRHFLSGHSPPALPGGGYSFLFLLQLPAHLLGGVSGSLHPQLCTYCPASITHSHFPPLFLLHNYPSCLRNFKIFM